MTVRWCCARFETRVGNWLTSEQHDDCDGVHDGSEECSEGRTAVEATGGLPVVAARAAERAACSTHGAASRARDDGADQQAWPEVLLVIYQIGHLHEVLAHSCERRER